MTDNHAELLEGYKAIAEILNRHDITFYGMYGTALGVIRHSGFIPWDDDLDIAVYAKDLDVINKVLFEELDPKKYYYHNPSADTHPHVIIRTENFEQDMKDRKVTFIDLFVLVGYPESKIRRAFSYPFCGTELLSTKVIDESSSKTVRRMFYWVLHASRKMIKFISTKDSDMVCVRMVQVSKYAWKRSIFGEPRMHAFEDIEIPIPNACEEFLTQTYGDYMTPPPEDQRSGASGFPYSLLNDYLEDQGSGEKHPRLSSDDFPF